MLNCNNLSVEFANYYLFKDVQLNLLPGNRYAVVGANGTGKSTFLKLLAEEEQPSAGMVDKPKNVRIGLLKQDHFRYKNERVIDVVIDGKPELTQTFLEKEDLLTKPELNEKDCYRLAELEEIILALDGYSAENKAEKILHGLGIAQDKCHGPLSALSGGYKLRVLLAQSLFQNPDILLLDEPTNHLDIISIQWLEEFLVHEYRGLLIFVTHDKQLINNLATHILDIDYETITLYHGNYEKFIDKKTEVLEQKEKELAHKQEKIDAMQEFADRFRYKASKAKQVMSRLKMIEKIELPDIKNTSRAKPYFNFPQKHPSGKQVLQIKHLTKSFNEKNLFKNINIHLARGQKCALIGPNGVGKSTLLKILLNYLNAEQGHFNWNENVSIGYFAQDFHDLLKPQQTLLQWLIESVPGTAELTARKALGQMLFSGDEVNKKIAVLSGGECARLIFAKLILEQHNVLVLDEPTNHLDLETIDGLMEGLANFTGTILFVSHNRFFVQKIASSLLVMSPDKVDFYSGTYQEYLDKMGHDYLLRLCANVS